MEQTALFSFFQQKLLDWYDPERRPMPWKSEKNPYRIWLSEIILQQTRVEQGLPYYHRFIENFPTVHDLANASEDEVLKCWEGLGYYSRARNLHAAARYISKEQGGVFPYKHSDILALKGVGPYTAAAIASFAFDAPYAVVDGNVYRVLSRFFGIDVAIDSTAGKKQFSTLAQQLLDIDVPATYNQAIIDFGAIQCKPKNPDCAACPFEQHCFAKQNELIDELPFKSKKLKKRLRFFTYLVSNHDTVTFIRKRTAKDIWKGLYEFPYIESSELLELPDIFKHTVFRQWITSAYSVRKFSKPFQQVLSHQKIVARFLELDLTNSVFNSEVGWLSIDRKQLAKFAFPRIIDLYLRDNSLYLELH